MLYIDSNLGQNWLLMVKNYLKLSVNIGKNVTYLTQQT